MDYKGQYYNEALLHYGVLGMKWGKRKADRKIAKIEKKIKKKIEKAANLEKRAKSESKGYLKEYGRALVNMHTNPIRSGRANIKNAMKMMITDGRIIRNKHDLKDMNAIVDMSKAESIRAKVKSLRAKANKIKARRYR